MTWNQQWKLFGGLKGTRNDGTAIEVRSQLLRTMGESKEEKQNTLTHICEGMVMKSTSVLI